MVAKIAGNADIFVWKFWLVGLFECFGALDIDVASLAQIGLIDGFGHF